MIPLYVICIITLLGIGFLGTKASQTLKLPHSVFLVILGIAGGMLLRSTNPELAHHLSLEFSEIILFILLPPLIFESAYQMDFSDFKKDFVPISILASFALIISTALIGFGLHYGLGIELIPALVFGSLISATDPVAVVALFKEVGAPKRLNTLVEGESLLNDGIAIVLFRVLVAAAAAPVIDSQMFTGGMMQFVTVAIGGASVGLIFAFIFRSLLRFTASSAPAQLGITVSSAYLTFVIADHYLHVSGVIATLTLGLYLGSHARLTLNKDALHGMHYLWEFLALSANTLVFLAVGVAINPGIFQESISYILPTLGIVYLARTIAVPVSVAPLNLFKLTQPISKAYQVVLVWGGLRGGLALALVLLLPESFAYKPLFLALASAVVLSTLLLNALTVAPIMNKLGVNKLSSSDENFYYRSLKLVFEKIFSPLHQATGRGGLSENVVNDIENKSNKEMFSDNKSEISQSVDFDFKQFLLDEKHYYDEKIEDAAITKSAYQRLIRLVNRRLDIFNEKGSYGLHAFELNHELRESKTSKFMQLFPKRVSQSYRVKEFSIKLEVLLNLEFAIKHALHNTKSDEVKKLAEKWLVSASNVLEGFYKIYPSYGLAVQASFVANTVAASSEHVLHELREEAIISQSVYSQAKRKLHLIHDKRIKESTDLLNPTMSQLLVKVPLFTKLPPMAIDDLSKSAKKKVFSSGENIVNKGEQGDSFYLVLMGLLEVDVKTPDGTKPRLFTGDFFGELSLLLEQPRNATVTAVIDTEIAEIDANTFALLLNQYPEVEVEVKSAAQKRLNA